MFSKLFFSGLRRRYKKYIIDIYFLKCYSLDIHIAQIPGGRPALFTEEPPDVSENGGWKIQSKNGLNIWKEKHFVVFLPQHRKEGVEREGGNRKTVYRNERKNEKRRKRS